MEEWKSEMGEIASGLPQGSILGLLFFLIYISGLINELESMHFPFVDKLKPIGNRRTSGMQKNLQFRLNTDKCELLTVDV